MTPVHAATAEGQRMIRRFAAGVCYPHICPGEGCAICQRYRRYDKPTELKRKYARPQGKTVVLEVKGVIDSGVIQSERTGVDRTECAPDHARCQGQRHDG